MVVTRVARKSLVWKTVILSADYLAEVGCFSQRIMIFGRTRGSLKNRKLVEERKDCQGPLSSVKALQQDLGSVGQRLEVLLHQATS